MDETTDRPATVMTDLEALVEVQPDAIVSRTFLRKGGVRGIVFAFDAGQELSEHTSSHEAIIQVLSGTAAVSLGKEHHDLSAGSWVHMPARLSHAVRATTPLVMVLLMLGND
jgi:quercetin dioxygenase-like cupin family protein